MTNIKIRKYTTEDMPGFYQAVMESRKEVSKWLPWCSEHYSIHDTEEWVKKTVPKIWASKKGCEFVIVDTKEKKIVGGCCLEQIDAQKKEASIGYWVRTGETKKGIATKACLFLIDFGFRKLGLESIKVIPSKENHASRKVADKLPYETMKIVENGFQIRDQVSDALVYVISTESYLKSQLK